MNIAMKSTRRTKKKRKKTLMMIMKRLKTKKLPMMTIQN
jgi:hypothetical protein